MASSSASPSSSLSLPFPSSSLSQNWEHDVFPSFHGPDVRKTFLSHILKEFRSKGINLFIDNEITRGKSIGPELKQAIRGSKIAIVLLSKNYASSSWCLDELVEIMKKELGQTVITIFYEVDPTVVKKQTGDFGRVFKKTCQGKTKKKIEGWRKALEAVSTIAGYHSRTWDDEAAMIENIAADISKKLNHLTPSPDFDHLIGMGDHMERMKLLLRFDLDEVRMIGIWGPPGIGKTTIARFLFNQVSSSFQNSAIMVNIRGSYPRPCLDEYNAQLQLQKQMLSEMINQKDIVIPHLGVAQGRLRDKKVLLVLDDVDRSAQLDALAKNVQWFGPRSRIIITTEDLKLLKAYGINHIYKVNFPSDDEALQMFCVYAFGRKTPKDGFAELAREITYLVGQLPLGLKVMGSYFRGLSEQQWSMEVPRLRANLNGEIESILKFSYDALCDEDKDLFLHIACFFNGNYFEKVEEYLAESFKNVRQRLHLLAERSLISIDGKYIRMHTLLAQLGTEIVRKQSVREPGPRQFLVDKKDICEVLTDYKAVSYAVDIYCEDKLQYSFASHLSMDFRRKGIYASVNCNETLDVIEGARASVVVFSKNYLSSTSCLDNLVRILQCRRKNGQLVVVPVFYGVSPSDVVVPEHKSADRIKEWSSALQELRELQGHQSRERFSDCELVEEIVKDVYKKLFPAENIGIDSKLLEIEHLLRKQTWDVRRIGIWGMPGIGKTTLARAFFDQISGGYEASCFIQHFDKAFHEKGIHRLLMEHFGNILKDLPRVCSSITRPSLPRDKLSKKRTLVVLDDVHNPLVAESFLGGFHWFGSGSLIIITSRDKQVFSFFQINHVYMVQNLNVIEALQLFSQCAFGQDIREPNLLELSMEVIDYANGNPLALSFYGRELKGRRISEMWTTFLKLKLRTPYKIYDLFKSSYETLNDNEKNIFLDVACFFKGENVDYVIQLLEGCGFFPHVGIDVLVEKCLVTISENRVKMHKIIQDFGREIINSETVQIERRRRLWEPWTIKFLLEDAKLEENEDAKATYTRALGTEDIEGIFLETSNLLFDVKPTAFENMLNLRFLKIYCSSDKNYYGLHLPKRLDSLPYELRLLHWENYPLETLPRDFDPCHLVELNMSNSQLQKLWQGTKNLKMLKTIRLCHSQKLTKIDDICRAQNIELIDLQGCTKLRSFPATGQLEHLRVVNLSGCKEIKSFAEVSSNIRELHLQGTSIRKLPISIGNATKLKELYLNDCSSLVELPASIGNATNLEILDLSNCTSLVEFPSSFGSALNLKEIYLNGCSSLVELPASIGNTTNLEILDLKCCSSLVKLPSFENVINLKEIYLNGCSSLVELPASIGNATNLEILDLSYCTSLVEFPSSFGSALNLKKLYLTGCSSLVELPASIRNATNLKILDRSSSWFANAINLKEY